MNEIPKLLESKWREEHKKSSEEAFERVAKEGQVSAGPSFFAKANEKLSTALSAKKD